MTPFQLLGLVAIFIVARAALTLRPVKTNSRSKSLAFAREYLDPFIVAGLAAFLLITFVARTYYIPSASMVPTLQIGDVLLVNKFEYRFHAPNEGDIVVFPPPIVTTDDFIKRVIGRPGDKLHIHAGVVYINDRPIAEPYVNQHPDYELVIKNYGIYVDGQRLASDAANVPPRSAWSAPDRIPQACYFMMGDNRNDSDDSHVWGFAQTSGTFATGPVRGQKAHFTGHAFVVFWPPSRVHALGR